MCEESMTGERNGAAAGLISSLFIQTESVLPFCIVIFKGVVSILSISNNCPNKKSVTGNIDGLSPVESTVGTTTLGLLWHPEKIRNKQSMDDENNFCISKITNKKNRCRVRSNGLRKIPFKNNILNPGFNIFLISQFLCHNRSGVLLKDNYFYKWIITDNECPGQYAILSYLNQN